MDTKRLQELAGIKEAAGDSINDLAIDMVDDMLDSLPEKEQYGQRGDILRHILKCLQGK